MAERPAREKLTHPSVTYGKGMPRSHCSICAHYIAPSKWRDGKPHCAIVRDPIAANAWCHRFWRK